MASCHSGHSRVQDILSIGALVKQVEEGKWILPQTPEGAQPCGHRETKARVGIRTGREYMQAHVLQLVTMSVGSSCLH